MTDTRRFGFYKNISKTILLFCLFDQSAHVTCCHAVSSFRESEILYFILREVILQLVRGKSKVILNVQVFFFCPIRPCNESLNETPFAYVSLNVFAATLAFVTSENYSLLGILN